MSTMSTMAENVIIAGSENRPLMLERIEKGPFQFGTIPVPGTATTPATTRDRTLDDLTPEEKIREACDIKATNIIFKGSELSLQERESTLYNKFDKFTSEKDVKLAKDMHNSNFNQLYAYLRQHEAHANEVRMMRQRSPDPLALEIDNPNITMEEYIMIVEEKARRRGKMYNWETAMYGKIWCDENIHDLRSVETEFLAIFYNDALTSEVALLVYHDFENEFPAIAYNDATTSKLDFSEPTDNDDDKIDIKQFLEDNVINTDVGAYA
ncbi:hypothetical protein Tco_0387189 [Tanacetum coccineum]